MGKQPTRGRYFEYRSGYKGFAYGGMVSKVDPGANPPDRPRFLINTRIQGGSIISRPDFSGHGAIVPARQVWDARNLDPTQELGWAAGASPYSRWAPHFACDLAPGGPIRIWFGGDSGYFGFIDTDYEFMLQSIGVYTQQDVNWGPDFAKFNNEFYVGDYGALRKIYLIAPLPGTAPASILTAPADEIIASFPGYRVSSMLSHAGKLFFVISDPGGINNAFVYSWDGQQITQELALGLVANTGTTLTTFFDTLVMTMNGVASLRVRAADGTWSSPALGGFVVSPRINSTSVYRAQLYIASGTDKIFSWDGATLALARTVVVGGRSVNNMHCLATMQGRLHYFWTDRTPNPMQVVQGYLDLDNQAANQWNDVGCAPAGTASFIANPGAAGGAQERNIALAVTEYRGRLWLGIGTNNVADPESATLLYTHQRQYVSWDGWFKVDGSNIVPGLGIPGPGQFAPSFGIRSFRRL